MPHYVAIVEEPGPGSAAGVWFPDLPGCCSAGEDIDEALRNAEEAIALYARELASEGQSLPPPRSLAELKSIPEVASDMRDALVALVAWTETAAA